jgi:hypothetical protein
MDVIHRVTYVNLLIVEEKSSIVNMVIEKKMAVKYANVMIHVIHLEK